MVGWGAPEERRSEHKKLDAAGYVQLHAGDVRGEIGAEERDGVGNVLWLARQMLRPRSWGYDALRSLPVNLAKGFGGPVQ